MSVIDINNWKEYKLTDIGFTIYHGERQRQADRIDGNVPLLTARKENQGVAAYISNPLCIYKDPITVDMFGNCFYHKGSYAGDDNIYFFVNPTLSDNIKLFISGVINTRNSILYNFKTQFRQPNANKLTVLLPQKNSQPDWLFMDEYMGKILADTKFRIKVLNDLVEKSV